MNIHDTTAGDFYYCNKCGQTVMVGHNCYPPPNTTYTFDYNPSILDELRQIRELLEKLLDG